VFDFRYHVVSLAAVFFALIIGILVGVALASHGLGDSERDRLQADLRSAQSRGDDLQAQVDAAKDLNTSDHTYVDKTYKLLMDRRLRGQRVAVLYVGSVDRDVQSAITLALDDADGLQLRLRALGVPLDEEALEGVLNGRPFLDGYAGAEQLDDLGRALGQEFVAGTDTPLWNALESLIVERKGGQLRRPADAVIVVRTVPAQQGATALFLRGLYQGLQDVGIPVIGVEVADGDGTTIEAFKKAELSTVDDIDTPVGRLALAILLADPAVTGNYGSKKPPDGPSDDGPLPTVLPLPTATGG
jgi:Copper transport outer membrane protein, MctB